MILKKQKIDVFVIFVTILTISHPSYTHNLVDISKINPDIVLDIRYATKNNFTKKILYPQAKCFLQKETADKLNKVQKELKTLGLGLKVFDGYRPYSIQFIMFKAFPDPQYVANPYNKNFKGSIHNRACAIDCTLVDLKTDKELAMPSKFDDFSSRAHRNYKKMPKKIRKNCKLLEQIMVKHGFSTFYNEWWHFNDKDWEKYPVLNISFQELS